MDCTADNLTSNSIFGDSRYKVEVGIKINGESFKFSVILSYLFNTIGTCIDFASFLSSGSTKISDVFGVFTDFSQPFHLDIVTNLRLHSFLPSRFSIFFNYFYPLGMAYHMVLLGWNGWVSFFAAISLIFDRSCSEFLIVIFRFEGGIFISFLFDGRRLSFFEMMVKMYIG